METTTIEIVEFPLRHSVATDCRWVKTNETKHVTGVFYNVTVATDCRTRVIEPWQMVSRIRSAEHPHKLRATELQNDRVSQNLDATRYEWSPALARYSWTVIGILDCIRLGVTVIWWLYKRRSEAQEIFATSLTTWSYLSRDTPNTWQYICKWSNSRQFNILWSIWSEDTRSWQTISNSFGSAHDV
jgi:hypothetical protein